MSKPLADEDEGVVLDRFRIAYSAAYGEAGELDHLAERYRFFYRDAALDSEIALKPKPKLIRGLVDSTIVEGLADLADLRGQVVVAAHFNHWNLPALVLGAAAHRGQLSRLVILARAPQAATLFTPEWYDSLGASGLACKRCLTVVAIEVGAARSVLPELTSLLDSGATVLVYADTTILPMRARATRVNVGRLSLPLPYGAATLADGAGRPLLTVRVGERSDGLTLTFSKPIRAAGRSAPAFSTELQNLFDAALAENRLHWQQWPAVGAWLGRSAGLSATQPRREVTPDSQHDQAGEQQG